MALREQVQRPLQRVVVAAPARQEQNAAEWALLLPRKKCC
jgi:hypothetical protein